MDGFDLLPDSIILLIFNSVSDVKSLIRCRSVSKRFNSLVPQTDSLLLRVDCVISPESDHQPLFLAFLKSLLKSINNLFNSDLKSSAGIMHTQNSPAQILSQFHRIRNLQIELPAGDLKLDKGIAIKWRADFGKSLRSCVILGFRAADGDSEEANADFGLAGGLKARVVWTISALIAASARHCLLKDVVKEHGEMERLILKDKEGEGTVVMEEEGLRECRKEMLARGGEWEWEASRTVVPSVRIRMRHEARVQLKNGEWMEGATLVIARPCLGKDGGSVGSTEEDCELAMKAFGDEVYRDAVQLLLNGKSYLLEMNSF